MYGLWSVIVSAIAIVGDLLPTERICRLTSFHTAPWSELCPPPDIVESFTDFFSTCRIFDELQDSAEVNCFEVQREHGELVVRDGGADANGRNGNHGANSEEGAPSGEGGALFGV